MMGPSLIFDKSSLESLSRDEAVWLDCFYSSVITPVFFVECLADLEKRIVRSKSTPEQLVGSLADRTPDHCRVNVHHLDVLRADLAGQFDMSKTLGRPCVANGTPVELGEQKGMVYKQTKEQDAMQRWLHRDFLDAERGIAKWWRKELTSIDLDAMSNAVLGQLGPHWRKPKTLQDAKQMADVIIDHMDPEWLLAFGIELLGVPETKEWVMNDWMGDRRPPLRTRYPYFVFMLSINIFFCLILPTQLLRNVKPSHHIDLAYLYYLPFCSVFTSKDNFHVQIVPLFLDATQTFVSGDELKADLKRLEEHYCALPEEETEKGLHEFARYPPVDTSFLTTRLWDTYLPRWRNTGPPPVVNEQIKKALMDTIKRLKEESQPRADGSAGIDEMSYVTMESKLRLRKGKWRRYSAELEARIIAGDANR
jgi:hypothetical protein